MAEEQGRTIEALRKEAKKMEKHYGRKIIELESKNAVKLEEMKMRLKEQIEGEEKKEKKEISSDERMRRSVISELIQTERIYLEDLTVIKTAVFDVLKTMDLSLTHDDEISVMISSSAKLLAALEKDFSLTFGENLPAIVGEFMDHTLTAYSEYCSGTFSNGNDFFSG